LTLAGVYLAFTLNGGLFNRNVPPVVVGETPIAVTATSEPALQIIAAGQTLQRGVVIPTEALISIPWPTSMVPPRPSPTRRKWSAPALAILSRAASRFFRP